MVCTRPAAVPRLLAACCPPEPRAEFRPSPDRPAGPCSGPAWTGAQFRPTRTLAHRLGQCHSWFLTDERLQLTAVPHFPHTGAQAWRSAWPPHAWSPGVGPAGLPLGLVFQKPGKDRSAPSRAPVREGEVQPRATCWSSTDTTPAPRQSQARLSWNCLASVSPAPSCPCQNGERRPGQRGLALALCLPALGSLPARPLQGDHLKPLVIKSLWWVEHHFISCPAWRQGRPLAIFEMRKPRASGVEVRAPPQVTHWLVASTDTQLFLTLIPVPFPLPLLPPRASVSPGRLGGDAIDS